jgi:hypothetical protein
MRHALDLRKLFYVAAVAYSAVQAGLYLVVNTSIVGLYADIALVLSMLSLGVCAGALVQLASHRRAGIEQHSPARSAILLAWRVGLWLLLAIRLVLAYRVNHVSTGLDSVTSYAWIAASLWLGGLSLLPFGSAPEQPPETRSGGRTLGKYQVRGLLGRGATGAVHDGWDPFIARRVAIKTIPLPSAGNGEEREMLARFRSEAQAAGRLVHPNIVGVFDYGETEECAYIVMEFVDGASLATTLERRRQLPPGEALAVMHDVLAGLQYSHERGIVHRDIKPANIMLTRDGRAKIADFGIARLDGGSIVTEVGKVVGTAAYMSPEQFLGEPVDARTDIFSAGVLLYKLLTGERPFEGGLTTIMQQVLGGEPPLPSARSVAVPPAFDRVVARAMAKRREDRYPTAAAFAQALCAAAAAGTEALEPTVLSAARADPAR